MLLNVSVLILKFNILKNFKIKILNLRIDKKKIRERFHSSRTLYVRPTDFLVNLTKQTTITRVLIIN